MLSIDPKQRLPVSEYFIFIFRYIVKYRDCFPNYFQALYDFLLKLFQFKTGDEYIEYLKNNIIYIYNSKH